MGSIFICIYLQSRIICKDGGNRTNAYIIGTPEQVLNINGSRAKATSNI